MNNNLTENKQNPKASDDAVAALIKATAFATYGFAGFAGSAATDVLRKNLAIKDSPYKGIRISKNENGYAIDLYILVSYDVNIPSVAWELQKSIKQELKKQCAITASAINIHVQGIKFPSDIRRN